MSTSGSSTTNTNISVAMDTTTRAAHAQEGGKDEPPRVNEPDKPPCVGEPGKPPCVSEPGASSTLDVSSAEINSDGSVSKGCKEQSATSTKSKGPSPSPKPKQPTQAPPLIAMADGEPAIKGIDLAQQAPSSSKTGCEASTMEKSCAVTNVTQDSSSLSSSPCGTTATADCQFLLPGGVNPLDITPVVQVFHDLKGVLVKWTFPTKYLYLQGGVKMYEIYAYIAAGGIEEVPPVSQAHWTKVGTIHPLKLPMAVTLNNILMTKKYSFSVRAVFDDLTRVTSQFSKPGSLREQ